MVRKLTIISISLIALNIGLLGMIFFHRGEGGRGRGQGPPRENFDRRLASRLDFSENQLSLYRERTRNHKERHEDLSMALLEVREGIHAALGTNDGVVVESLLPKMDSIHSLREREVVRYAQSILDICDEGQKEEFLRILRTSIEGRRGFQRRRRE